MPETQLVPVTVFNVEIAITIRLIADLSCNLHSLGPEFAAQGISIVDPDVGVPGLAIGIGQPVRTHSPCLGKLAQHDNDSTPTDHAKTRRIAPESFVVEAQLVVVVLLLKSAFDAPLNPT